MPDRDATPLVDGRPARVLVVDDEVGLAVALGDVFRTAGWQAEVTHTGADAVAVAGRFRPDVVVLDVMLPDVDGFAVLQRLRRRDDRVGVLFLSARTDVTDRVAGITAGGDDYVTKPFDVTEVLARVRGLLRRSGRASADAAVLRVGDLCLDEDTREVTRAGEVVALSATEFALLRHLVHHPRTVLSKAQLLEAVWHYDFGGNAHVVELYISYLRRKIDAGREPMIHTVRGAGYVLRPAT